MSRNRMILALVASAAGLAACATQAKDTAPASAGGARPIARADAWSGGYAQSGEAASADRPRAYSYDWSRRGELQSALNARIESASREIASLKAGSAPGSDCERRMRYLEAVRDSARENVSRLHELRAEEWAAKCGDLEDQVAGLELYLVNERSTCTVQR